ncbi:MAG TPA: ABC transporter family substrate-binding protein [Solirubrobacteraceae bacterium]|nr:ABC transporter family substrate-binding protein [Solirubrobacteraceae bacterium]
MSIHPPRTAVAALAVAAALVAGCGSSAGGGGGGRGELRASDVNPTPREQLRQGGVMRWAIEEFPAQLNLNQIDGTTDAAAQVAFAVMPRPFHGDDEARITPNRNYVASASVTATDPSQVVTYELNPQARWSDGKPITWRDYAAQWRALRDPDGDFRIASSTGYERIASVTAGEDDFEVVVTFARPFGDWRSLFDPLYPQSVNDDPRRFDTAYAGRLPVTGGPFRVRRIDETTKTITLERNPAWWGERALLDAIVFRTLPDDAIVSAFANGEVDFGDIGPDAAQYQRALGVGDGEVRQAGGPDFRHFTFNGTGPILRDVRVRRAVAMAIDREVITRADLTGLDWPVRTMGNHFLVNTQAGYADNSGDVGRFDPDRAAALLDEAGWTRDGALRRKDGRTLALRFVIPSGVATSRREAELAQGMLRDVGIRLDIRTVPNEDFFEKYVTPGNFDITAFSWLGTPFFVSSAKSIYVSPTRGEDGELQIQANYARIGSERLDALLTQAEQEVDRDRALQLVNEADRLVWDSVHSIVLYQRPQITAVRRALANVGAFGLAYKRYEDIGLER